VIMFCKRSGGFGGFGGCIFVGFHTVNRSSSRD
jgi:hypothetical protein